MNHATVDKHSLIADTSSFTFYCLWRCIEKLKTDWSALTMHTHIDPFSSIKTTEASYRTKQQDTLGSDCNENWCLWILHETSAQNSESLSCPGFERSLVKLYWLAHPRIPAMQLYPNCRNTISWFINWCMKIFFFFLS